MPCRTPWRICERGSRSVTSILAISFWRRPRGWREFSHPVDREVKQSGKYRSQIVAHRYFKPSTSFDVSTIDRIATTRGPRFRKFLLRRPKVRTAYVEVTSGRGEQQRSRACTSYATIADIRIEFSAVPQISEVLGTFASRFRRAQFRGEQSL